MFLKPNRLEDEIRLYVTTNRVPFTPQKHVYVTNGDNWLINFSVRTQHPIVLVTNKNGLNGPMRPYVLKEEYQQTLLFEGQRIVAARIISPEDISIREKYSRTPVATPVRIRKIRTISPLEYALIVDRYNILNYNRLKKARDNNTLTFDHFLLMRYF